MFDSFQNSVKMSMTLVPDGPLLLRSQNARLDPAIADVEFMRTRRDGQSTVYIPGSSIKGVVRAHTERLLKSGKRFVCDPTNHRDEHACGRFARHRPKTDYPHGGQCPACFTWGSLKLAGRFRFGDGYPPTDLTEAANRTEVRTGVGINRNMQAAQTGVLYDTEVVTGGGFAVTLSGENFDLWQLGLAAQALRDLDDGFFQVGGCKSRGMGAVRVRDMVLVYRSLNAKPFFLAGASSDKYGLQGSGLDIKTGEGVEHRQAGIFHEIVCKGEALERLFDSLCDGPLRQYLNG